VEIILRGMFAKHHALLTAEQRSVLTAIGKPT
jgi:hypothetical protein